jgi:hypothetical protein
MSTKTAFMTHEPPNVGKDSSFLPMTKRVREQFKLEHQTVAHDKNVTQHLEKMEGVA